MKKLLITAVTAAAGIGLFWLMVEYVGIDNILATFKHFSPSYLALFLAISVIINCISVYRWQLIVEGMGHKVPFMKLFAYKIMGASIGYLTPSARLAGEPFRAFMLHQKNVRMSKALSSVLLDKFIELTIDTMISCAIVLLLVLNMDFTNPVKLIFLLGAFLFFSAAGLIYFAFLKKLPMLSWLSGKLLKLTKLRVLEYVTAKARKVERYLHMFLQFKRKRFAKVLLVTILIWPLMFLQYKVALLMLGFNSSLLTILLIMIFFAIAIMIPIPANIGSLEAGQVTAFKLSGANPQLGIAMAILIRLLDILWMLLGLALLLGSGIKRARKEMENTENGSANITK